MANKTDGEYVTSMIYTTEYTEKVQKFKSLLDDLIDDVYNLNENVSYVRGQFGYSLELDTNDLISNVKSLSDFVMDSFEPAMKKVDTYMNILRTGEDLGIMTNLYEGEGELH